MFKLKKKEKMGTSEQLVRELSVTIVLARKIVSYECFSQEIYKERMVIRGDNSVSLPNYDRIQSGDNSVYRIVSWELVRS